MKRYRIRLMKGNVFNGLIDADQTAVPAGQTRIALGDCDLYLAHEADEALKSRDELLDECLEYLHRLEMQSDDDDIIGSLVHLQAAIKSKLKEQS